MDNIPRKPFVPIASALDNLKDFPADVQDIMGYAIDMAQQGLKHPDAKPLSGLGGGILEIVDDFDGNTYRGVYTVKFQGVVYLLHSFQKKSKSGISTPKTDIALIKSRYKLAIEHYKLHYDPATGRLRS